MVASNDLNISQTGFVTFDGISTFNGRTLISGTGVSITNANGVAGNPTISINGSVVGETITGNIGGSLAPTAGNWNLLGANSALTGYSPWISGSGSTLTVNLPGTVKWVVNATANLGTHTTIQAAITAASSGDDIFITAGSYTENLTLKAGVNLVAFAGDGNTPNVTLIGTCTMTVAGTCTISNIRLQTNSAALLAVTGNAASIVNLNNCYLNCSNNTGITFSSSSASAIVNVNRCIGDIGTTGIGIFAHSSAGALNFIYSLTNNSGSTLTASTVSAGSFVSEFSYFASPITLSSTAACALSYTEFNLQAFNTTCFTAGGSGSQMASMCRFFSGTASAISVGGTLNLNHSVIHSTNTNAITGAGTLVYCGLVFSNTSSQVNVTTQTIRNEGPSRTIGSANTGATNTLTVTNSSNTASSNALENITVGGTSAGDPFTTYTVSGTTNWSHGIDNSVTGDPFVLAASTALGTTNVMSASTAGEVNWPLQPAFLATSAGASNVTGDGTVYTIVFGNEIFDQNSDFDGTSTFTAPVTGRYRLAAYNVLLQLAVANTTGDLLLVTSNRTYNFSSSNMGAMRSAANVLAVGASVLADMDAADTATVTITIANGTKVVDIFADTTTFSGNLVC